MSRDVDIPKFDKRKTKGGPNLFEWKPKSSLYAGFNIC